MVSGVKRDRDVIFQLYQKTLREHPRGIRSYRGDLYHYLIRKFRVWPKYTGIELMPDFIAAARQQHPKATFIERDFLTWKTNQRYDYVVASGLLSVKVTNNDHYFKRVVRKMLKLARQGIAFNFLTIFRKDKLHWWYYYDPGIILDWCMSFKEVKEVKLITGYDPFDCLGDATIVMIKK